MNTKTYGDRYNPLYTKYLVQRVDERDGLGDKHHKCSYFVLDLTHDPLAAEIMEEYFRRAEQ